jgi:hypothetical protein
MIKNVMGDGWIDIQKTDSYGGVDISVKAGYMLNAVLEEMRQHLAEAKLEKQLRESDPSVRLAYDSYKMAVAMATGEDPAGQ